MENQNHGNQPNGSDNEKLASPESYTPQASISRDHSAGTQGMACSNIMKGLKTDMTWLLTTRRSSHESHLTWWKTWNDIKIDFLYLTRTVIKRKESRILSFLGKRTRYYGPDTNLEMICEQSKERKPASNQAWAKISSVQDRRLQSRIPQTRHDIRHRTYC